MRFPYLPALAALALGSAAAVTTLAQQQPTPPTRVAFIDLGKAYDTYRKYGTTMESLGATTKDMRTSLQKRRKAIEDEVDQLNVFNPGTPQYVELDRKIALDKYAYEFDQKGMRDQFEEERRKRLWALYKEISLEAEAYGAEHGYAAVELFLPLDFDFGGDPTLFALTRAVVWRDPQLDITKDIVERLNAQLPPPPTKPAVVDPPPKSDPPPKADPPKVDDPKQKDAAGGGDPKTPK